MGGYGPRHGIEPALRGRVRLLLWLMAISSLGVGFQALFTPRSFYDDFPMGRGWVAMDGPYNEHLVRDVGSLNLALVVLVFAALIVVDARAGPHRRDRLPRERGAALRCTTCGTSTMDGMAAGDQVGIAVSLGLAVVLPRAGVADRHAESGASRRTRTVTA